MDLRTLYYQVFCGIRKNAKLPYFLRGISMLLTPKFLLKRRRLAMEKEFDGLSADLQSYIEDRVNYYCQTDVARILPTDSPQIGEHTYRNKQGGSVYFFDTYEYTRYFPDDLRWRMAPGDITRTFDEPTVAKTRPISGGENTTILNMDKVRHFTFFKDPIPWEKKMDGAIFRGSCYGKPNRQRFLEMFAENDRHSVRDCCNNSINPLRWQVIKPTPFYDHLKYKYIVCLEGNELASNLKWVMGSNSIAVSPRMKYESWFMEGRLVPNYHYIEVADDYHDFEEKLSYYTSHPEEAKSIVQNANAWVQQFQDKHLEDLIAVRTMEKYFRMSGQNI